MPNIGTVLKEEIARLSRKEVRSQFDPTKKATAQHRRDIALLKRQVAQLERHVKLLSRKTLNTAPSVSSDSPSKRVRFVAKGLRTQRERLGLSAADYGRMVGVSAQSIYNWEQGHASPRPEQLTLIAGLRGIGKRDAQRRLEQLVAKSAKSAKRPRKR